jgi:hypothetical protein
VYDTLSTKLSRLSVGWILFAIFALGVATKSYGIRDHWKTHDHYNYGGAIHTHFLNCAKKLPFDVTRGLMTYCIDEKPQLYPNHSPAFLYVMWGLTLVFGEGEWVHRLFTLIFSALNILLVFQLARLVWPNERLRPLTAAFFQAFFLGPMYFGTHLDPITEFTLTFMLLSAIATLKSQIWRASFWALVAGLTAWIGFFQFASILLICWIDRKNFKQAAVATALAFVACIAFIMFLIGTVDIYGFIMQKIFDPTYIPAESTLKKLAWPLIFIKTIASSHARLLSPLFAGFTFYELFFGSAASVFTIKRERLAALSVYHKSLILIIFGSTVYCLIGPKYVMVHMYSFNFFMPAYALMCANLTANLLKSPSTTIARPNAFFVTSLVFVIVYPYGAFKSSFIHDVINSLMLAGSALFLLKKIWSRTLMPALLTAAISVSALANFSQTMNYRNEPDTEFPFCESARAEYARTGAPVHTKEPWTRTKAYLYCMGIPIVYE